MYPGFLFWGAQPSEPPLPKFKSKEGDFKSKEDLANKLVQFIVQYNKEAKPFAWTYKGRPLQIE